MSRRLPLRPQNKFGHCDVPHQGDLNTLDVGLQDSFNGDEGCTLTLVDHLAIGGEGMALNTVGSSINGGFTTTRGGRANLAHNDFDKFNPARTRQVVVLFSANQWVPGSGGTPISAPYQGVKCTGTTSAVGDAVDVFIPKRMMHHGATLDSIEFRFRVTTARLALPATQPLAVIYRHTAAGVPSSLGFQSVTAAGYDVYYNGGRPQGVTITGIAHTVDTSTGGYRLRWNDETGANALPGNVVHAAILHFTNIADARFQ